MAESGQDKTEAPTPHKLSEARQQGNVPKSTDLTASVILLAATLGIYVVARPAMGTLEHTMRAMLGGAHAQNLTRADDLVGLTAEALRAAVIATGPLMAVIVVVALAATLGQVGFLLTGKPLTPSLAKMNPIKGLKQLVSIRSSVRLLMSLGKVALLSAVSAVVILRDVNKMLHIAEMGAAPAFAAGAWMVFELALILAVILIVLAAADLWYQRWQHTEDLKMTRQDVKQDMKNMNGDPEMKQRRARVARQLALQRAGSAVPQADVIVTNPTHYAVALKYDNDSMSAPKVVAKGADFMALQIRKLAAVHGIPLIERKPLARALYANVEVGQEVPEEHYAAVAEILAYVYRISGKQVA